MYTTALAVLLAASFGVPAFAADEAPGAGPHADQKFLHEAARGGMLERELGRLASARARNAEVKQFGNRMVKDHGKVAAELEQLARREGVALPNAMTDEQQGLVDRLSKLEGAEFDRAYTSVMVAEHEKDVKAFENVAQTASDPDVKRFAAKQAPVLRQHLAEARSLDEEVSGATSGAGRKLEPGGDPAGDATDPLD